VIDLGKVITNVGQRFIVHLAEHHGYAVRHSPPF
jgi:hypothetical protein